MTLAEVIQRLRATADELEASGVMGGAARDPLGGPERAAIAEEVASLLRHDLRNSLGSIRNAAFYLRRRTQGSDAWTSDPRVPQFFALIDESVTRASSVVEERLDLGRLFARRVARAEGRACVARAVASARVPASVRVDVDAGPGDVDVDVAEAALGLRCLVENAAEATASGGRVAITARAQGERFVVEVRDEGAGLAEGEQPFEAFHTTKEGHAGLGLSIARRIARRYGGELTGERAPDGTRMIFTLPLAAADPGEARAPRSIFLVDDDASNLITFAALLEGEGFRVDTSASFAEAEQALGAATAPYEIVIVDQRLGDGSGLDLVPTLRARMPAAKAVLLSGSGGDEDAWRRAGFDAYVTKGTAFAEVLAILDRLQPRGK